jgi:O-6-methylguanine DNA methyltransferase
LSIVIPCHRVVGKNGGLGGYAGGLDRKKRLLKAEVSQANFKLAPAGK